MPPAHLREPAARLFYTDTPDLGDVTHVIDKGLALVAHVGAKPVEPAFPLDVPPSGPAREVVARHRSGFALLNPGAAWPNKQWPADRFGALAARLRAEHGLPSVVLWGPAERERAQQVVAASGGTATLAPETRITDIFAMAQAARLDGVGRHRAAAHRVCRRHARGRALRADERRAQRPMVAG